MPTTTNATPRPKKEMAGQGELTAKLSELRLALQVLRDLLGSTDHMRIVHAFLIPVRGRDGDQPKHFPVRGFPSADMADDDEAHAREAVIEALTFIDFKDDQHPKATLRTPGLCEVSDEALEAIRATNLMRQEISDLVARDRNPDERTRFWRTQRGVCPLQVIRQTLILEQPEHIRFYWVEDGSFKKYTPEALIEEFRRRFKVDPSDDSPFWVAPLKELIKDGKTKYVAVKREGTPQVRARIKGSFVKIDKKSDRPEQLTSLITGASVPFVVRMDSPAPVVIPLTSKTATTKDKEIPKKIPEEGEWKRQKLLDDPLLPSLHVYCYDPKIEVKPPLETSHRNTIRTSREK